MAHKAVRACADRVPAAAAARARPPCVHRPPATSPFPHAPPSLAFRARGAPRGRPWEMALVVYGFTTQVQALQFEWAWQHPERSKAVRAVAAGLKSHQKYGTAGKVGPA